jgi:hypothetical protein
MKTRITNLNFDGVIVPIAEIEITDVYLTSKGTAKTKHKVSSVRTIEGEEVIKELKNYNHPFELDITSVFNTAMQSLANHLADPTT